MLDQSKFEKDIDGTFQLFIEAHNRSGGSAFASIAAASELIGSLIRVMSDNQVGNEDDLMEIVMGLISETIDNPMCEFMPHKREASN